MRRFLGIAVVTAGLVLVPAPALAQSDESDESSGSLVVQAMQSAEGSLGADVPVAVARAIDRGYDGLQVVEGLFDAAVAADGTITEDDEPLPPFGTPSNLIEDDGGAVVPAAFTVPRGGAAEQIAFEAVAAGIRKTTKQLDKKYDLDARAERLGVDELGSFTMMMMIAARMEGYSPEQIILDGLLGEGLRIRPFGGIDIVDENGKLLTPGVEEVSEEQEETGAVIESFVLDTVDMIGGIDPHTATETPFDPKFKVDIEIIGGDDYSLRITGDGVLGTPGGRDRRRVLVGKGDGTLEFSGACALEGVEEPHPYEVDGPVEFGMSGQTEDGTAKLRLAITDANLSVKGDDSLCVDIVRDTAEIVETISFLPADLRLRIGETATVEGSLGGDPVGLEITIRA